MDCPRCGSSDVTPSHRRGGEKITQYIIPRNPYRCKECWSRFWKFENPLKSLKAKVAAVMILVGLAIIFLLIPVLNQAPEPVPKTVPVSIPKEPSPTVIPKDRTPIAVAPVEITPPSSDQERIQAFLSEKDTDSAKSDGSVPVKLPAGSPTVVRPDSQVTAKKVETKTPGIQKQTKKADQSQPRQKSGVRMLKGIWHASTEGEFRMSLAAGGPIRRFKHFMMEGPTRLVILLKGNWEYPGKTKKIATGDMIRTIRVGEHADHLSIVLDFKEDIPVKRYLQESEKGLSVIVRRAAK